MRIVITGASGNIGTALLRLLGAEAEHELVGVARRPPAPSPPYDRVRWVQADLSEPASETALLRATDGADALVHLAWGFQPSHDQSYLQRLGVDGTRRVIAAVQANDVPHLVHQSSVGAYSPKADDRPVDESWPTDGVPSSPYSRHKATAERMLDRLEAGPGTPLVARMRPGIVGQRDAGSGLLRYGVPFLLPAQLLRLLPLLPLDRRLRIPMVHADDVADAIVRVLDQRAAGAFNLAADPPVTTDLIAQVLGSRAVHVPAPLVRGAASLAWHARLQQVDPGWLDLGFSVPLLDCGRARRELGWAPSQDAAQVLAEVVDGMQAHAHGSSAPLRERTVRSELTALLRRGPVSRRRLT